MVRPIVKHYAQGLSRRLRPPQRALEFQPNILFLFTDQHRWDAMGCAGEWVETPTLDRIAAEGVRFTNAYTNSPVCIPARVSLATGLYPFHHRVWDNRKYTLSPKAETWMQTVRDAGYGTSVFGKIHVFPEKGDLRDQEWLANAYGFEEVDEVAGPKASLASKSNLTDLWREAGVFKAFKEDLKDRLANRRWTVRPSPLPFELYPDVYVARRAMEYLRNYDRDQPWFCWVGFPGPHEPWDAPEPYGSRYKPEDMPPPAARMRRLHPEPTGFLDQRLADQIPFEDGDVARMRANYAGSVSLIDDQIAGILKVIEERGELDRTVIAFSSDHGEMNGDHGIIYKKAFLNGAVRIPLLLRVPPGVEGFARGAVSSSLVELMDLGLTLSRLSGGRYPKRSRARNLVPLLKDPQREHRQIAVAGLKKEIMVATADWRLMLNRAAKPYGLFDLKNDPQESTNLVGDPNYDEVIEGLIQEVKKAYPGYWRKVAVFKKVSSRNPRS
jgi:choline-sulfatase